MLQSLPATTEPTPDQKIQHDVMKISTETQRSQINFFFFFFKKETWYKMIQLWISLVAQGVRICCQCKAHRFYPWSGKILCRGPTKLMGHNY